MHEILYTKLLEEKKRQNSANPTYAPGGQSAIGMTTRGILLSLGDRRARPFSCTHYIRINTHIKPSITVTLAAHAHRGLTMTSKQENLKRFGLIKILNAWLYTSKERQMKR